MVRAYAEPPRGARFAAIVGIVAFLDVPIVHFSVYWWRTLHPSGPTPANPVANSGLGAPELTAFFTALAAFTLLFAWLLALRTRLGRLAAELDDLEMRTITGAPAPLRASREVVVT
jgi:heme exporter protein C